MNEPYYEVFGPDAVYVRNHQLNLWKAIFTNKQNCHEHQYTMHIEYIISNVLKTYIPDTMTDFGSFRGYLTFGLDQTLHHSIENAIKYELNRNDCI